MKTIGIVLEPLDTLFFRGGRPFLAGLPGESSLPNPQTLAGFVRTLLLERSGANFGAMRGKKGAREAFEAAGAPWLAQVSVRGPFLAELGAAGPEPILRAPADLTLGENKIQRLQPSRRAVPGWEPPEEGMLPLWRRGGRPGKTRPQYLSWAGVRVYVEGRELDSGHLVRGEDLYVMEERTGIEVDAQRWAAADEKIYAVRTLRLKRGVVFYGEADLPDEAEGLIPEETAAPWGGERHHVRLRRSAPVTWPAGGTSGRRALVLMAPAFVERPWHPASIPRGALRAAAIEGPFAVSGWDYANGGPKPTRFGVDAGSVYFVEGGEPTEASLSDRGDDALLGYGFYLKGTWEYAE